MSTNKPARWWIGTLREDTWIPSEAIICGKCRYVRGQLEEGGATGYRHWQVLASFSEPVRRTAVATQFGGGHWEVTRSAAARDYVWKEATRIEGTQFEYGQEPFRRNEPTDWDNIRKLAKSGELDAVPADIYVRCYNQLKRIVQDHLCPIAVARTVKVYWGISGSGKSYRAWEEAGVAAYGKDPRTKWWCAYRGQPNVVIDEFRGGIDIAHMLRWLDRYPVLVETKGGSVPLAATTIWITSNLEPAAWYPEIDDETRRALMRRLEVTHFSVARQ